MRRLMVVVLDNRDSFVFNLARYVEELGSQAKVVRSDKISIEELKSLKPTHLIISPGPCGPNEAGISIEALIAFYRYIPVLGVCLGHQVIGHVFGGKVQPTRHVAHGKPERILHNEQGIFYNIPNPMKAGRYHSLIVALDELPHQLEVIAKNKDDMIMGLKVRNYDTYGVQFHPESILTVDGHLLIKNFLSLDSTALS